MAIGAMLQARRRGVRVPEDLSIIGIDNHEFSEAMGLTTVAQDPVEQGQQGTRMLLDELAGSHGAVQTTVAPHHLIVRESTAPPSN
jgi:DNA-binding LacI/PurR family transcriptional regulator